MVIYVTDHEQRPAHFWKICATFKDLILKAMYSFFGTLDYAFHFPDQGVTDVVQISGMRSLTVFTVCFWMSSSNTQGTLFSYAVSNDDDNELLIEYNGHFKLVIANERRYVHFKTRESENDIKIANLGQNFSGSLKIKVDD